MLDCDFVTKSYYNKTAVNGVCLHIPKGQICALLGPNGSGKTTLMKMIAGLIRPTSGKLLFEKNEIGIESKKKVAYMSTEPFFYSYMNVKDVGTYYHDFFEDFCLERYHELLSRMQLQLTLKAKTLSSGMAAKLKIAATLARDASLYLLDEPLNGIDIIARDQIIGMILEMVNPNASFLISSHLVDELEKMIHRAIFMKEGSLILSGETGELKEKYSKSIVDLYKEIYGAGGVN